MEWEVTLQVQKLKVSADTPGEAIARATEKAGADLAKHTTWANAEKVERIKVTGLERQ